MAVDNDTLRRIGAHIRVARQGQRMTLDVLGAATDLSTAFLSRLERGEASASIGNLIRVAAAVGLKLADIFAEPAPEPRQPYTLIRRTERAAPTAFAGAGYSYVPLGGNFAAGLNFDAFELAFPADAAEPMPPVSHGGEEFLYLLAGRLEFRIGADSFVMQAGDSLHFDCKRPHMGRAVGGRPARLLMVVSRQAGRKLAWWEESPRVTTRSKPAQRRRKA